MVIWSAVSFEKFDVEGCQIVYFWWLYCSICYVKEVLMSALGLCYISHEGSFSLTCASFGASTPGPALSPSLYSPSLLLKARMLDGVEGAGVCNGR